MQSTPGIGWVRGSDAMSSIAANELARLSEENGKLRQRVDDLVGQEVPNLGFELERISASGAWDDPHSNYRQFVFSVTLKLNATLRRGLPVGFRQKGSSLALQIGEHVSIKLENYFAAGTGASIDQLSISGPTAFGIHASGKVNTIPEDTKKLPARLVLTMVPIGYQTSYRIVIPLKAPTYANDREEWGVDNMASLEQTIVPTLEPVR
jgi:hypothetical protein